MSTKFCASWHALSGNGEYLINFSLALILPDPVEEVKANIIFIAGTASCAFFAVPAIIFTKKGPRSVSTLGP
ncbi:MAG: hypothetical protein NTW11_00460 [Candidatus Staskawiczbacteria bacterium]|nr:hypothetical protein [Candidatus Staskawiczbacteria bacterium]